MIEFNLFLFTESIMAIILIWKVRKNSVFQKGKMINENSLMRFLLCRNLSGEMISAVASKSVYEKDSNSMAYDWFTYNKWSVSLKSQQNNLIFEWYFLLNETFISKMPDLSEQTLLGLPKYRPSGDYYAVYGNYIFYY